MRTTKGLHFARVAGSGWRRGWTTDNDVWFCFELEAVAAARYPAPARMFHCVGVLYQHADVGGSVCVSKCVGMYKLVCERKKRVRAFFSSIFLSYC